LKVNVTRSSVAAGDDVDAPHAQHFTFPESLSMQDILDRIVKAGYLARISGGNGSWVATSHIPVAVIAQQWPGARMLTLSPGAQGKTNRTNGEMRLPQRDRVLHPRLLLLDGR